MHASMLSQQQSHSEQRVADHFERYGLGRKVFSTQRLHNYRLVQMQPSPESVDQNCRFLKRRPDLHANREQSDENQLQMMHILPKAEKNQDKTIH